MRFLGLAWVLAVLALTMWVSAPTMAAGKAKEDKLHEGKIVKVGDGKLTMTDKDDQNEHTHVVPATAKITCDGKQCKLEDLKAGFFVKVRTTADQTVTRIDASKEEKK